MLMKPININQPIFIDYTDSIDWFPMIDFHRLGTPGNMIFTITFLITGQPRPQGFSLKNGWGAPPIF